MFRTFVVGVLALLAVGMAIVMVRAADEQDGASRVLQLLIEERIRQAAVLPEIENGAVVGELPKSVKLMEYIVADYKGRLGQEVSSVTYGVSAGIGNETQTATAVGHFRKGTGPIATYMLALGTDPESWNGAGVLISYRNKQGAWRIRSTVRWDDTAKVWKRGFSVTPGPTSAPEEIAEIK